MEDKRLKAGGQVRGQEKGLSCQYSGLRAMWRMRMENMHSRARSVLLILSLVIFVPKHTIIIIVKMKLIC